MIEQSTDIKHCKSFYDQKQSKTKLTVHQGGSRSGKTFSICEWLIRCAWQNREAKATVFTIARKTLPSCKATVMRDFFDILEKENLYERNNHNKSDNTYRLYNTLFEFIGIDESQKVRGRKRDVLFMNEANEFSFDDFTQLMLRTEGRAILDYNPSDEFHWIYEHVIPRQDSTFYKSTYKDNPFLDIAIIQEIEHLKEINENLWRVFGLGERGASTGTIYTNWKLCPTLLPPGDTFYGLDFGYNNPSALVKVHLSDNDIYAKEEMYQSYLTTTDLVEKLKAIIDIPNTPIYADAAEPDRIAEIRGAGFNITGADKDVRKGIDSILSRRLFVTEDSGNLIKELRSYCWRIDTNGKMLDKEPVKFNDHLCDALRYAVHTHCAPKKYTGEYAIR